MKILIILALAAYIYIAFNGFIKRLKFILSVNVLSERRYGPIILKTKWITTCFIAHIFWPITYFVQIYLFLRMLNHFQGEKEDIKKYFDELYNLAEKKKEVV